jgi:hypothetical protein
MPGRALILLLYVAAATALADTDFRVRDHRERGFAEYSPAVVAGTEGAPGRYRVLAPYAYHGLARATGLPPRESWVLFRWLSLFAALLAAHLYFSTWFDRAGAVLGALLIAALLPLTFTNGWAHPDHFVELCLFTLACACVARGWTAWFAIVLALNAFNRETSAFLVLLFLLAGPIDRRRVALTAAVAALWAAISVGLRWWLGFQPYDPWELGRNFDRLVPLPDNYPPLYRIYGWFAFILLAPLVTAVVSAWRELPRFARGAASVAAVFFLTGFTFSSVIETRIFTPLLPLLAPAVAIALSAAPRRARAT